MLPNNLSADEVLGTPRAATRCIQDIPAEKLAWLWTGRIPLGKLTVISGDPGLGKSLVTLAIAAAVSRGASWPCHEGNAPLGEVILVSAEDDAADTIRPRLEAAKADLSRIHVLDAVEFIDADGMPRHRPWNFGDVEALEVRLAEMPNTKLLVVDPLSAYLAATDSNKNADVRALLAPLAEMAARRKVAVVCISHLNKSSGPAMYRTTGSLAFVAAARAVYAVAKDKDDADRRLVLPVKCNLSADSTGLAYRIGVGVNGSPVVEWEAQPVTISAEEALAIEPDETRSQTDEAVDWLRAELFNGPVKAGEIQRQGRQAGIGDKALRRARERLGIRPKKSEFSGGWVWTLPEAAHEDAQDAQDAQDAHPQNVGTFVPEGHLRDPDPSKMATNPKDGQGVHVGEVGHLVEDTEIF